MIIGITGTPGAGKGAVVEYLTKNRQFTHVSARAFFTEEMNKRSIAIDRDSMTAFANDFRRKHGPGAVFNELLRRAEGKGGKVVIESLRTLGEVDALKKTPNAYLLAVTAPQAIRYERISGRKSALDAVSFEKFKEQEERETASRDPAEGNIAGCIERADVVIINDASLKELNVKIEEALARLGAY